MKPTITDKLRGLSSKNPWVFCKYVFFLFWTLSNVGPSYAFESPAALKDLLFLENKEMVSPQQYEYIFSGLFVFYSAPNIIFPLFNGYFIDQIGVQKMSILLTILIVIGQGLVTLGCKNHSFSLMFLGRLLFGYGAESLNVAQNVFVTEYFEANVLAFPISLGNAMGLLGANANYLITPSIAQKFGATAAFFLAWSFCVFTLLCVAVMVCLDGLLRRKLGDCEESRENRESQENLLEFEESQQNLLEPEAKVLTILEENDDKTEEIAGIRGLKPCFWALLLCSVAIYGSNIGFNSIAVSYFVEKWFPAEAVSSAEVRSAKIISLNSLTTAATSILLAFIMPFLNDFLAILNAFTAIMSLTSFVLLALAASPLISLLLNGIGSSFNYNILNTLIPLLVNSKSLGLAYGVSVAGNNLGTSLIPLIVALLRNCYDNYDYVIICFVLLNVLGVVSAGIFVALQGWRKKPRENQGN